MNATAYAPIPEPTEPLLTWPNEPVPDDPYRVSDPVFPEPDPDPGPEPEPFPAPPEPIPADQPRSLTDMHRDYFGA